MQKSHILKHDNNVNQIYNSEAAKAWLIRCKLYYNKFFAVVEALFCI